MGIALRCINTIQFLWVQGKALAELKDHSLLPVAMAQWVRAFALQAEGWVFNSQL